MARQDKRIPGILALTALLLQGTALHAGSPTLSQQLLQSYFDTAGVCTTSQVIEIRDTVDIVTIEIDIEPKTRKGLMSMDTASRDDWFSLHCPPEIHGVWRHPEAPNDILVTGTIGEDKEAYTLSCVDYQQAQWGARELTLRNRIQLWLQEKLTD